MKKTLFSYVPLKRGILYYSMCFCMLGLFSCTENYDDTWIKKETEDLKDRITALEERQKSLNADIQAIQYLIKAREGKDYITEVLPLADGSGYVISFRKSGNVIIRHGKKDTTGDTPVIGIQRDETTGRYYWTVNGAFLLEQDNKIPVTGTGEDEENNVIIPQVRINYDTKEWEISIDKGNTYTSTGIKATGNKETSMFENIDNSHPDNIVFTLKGGEKITLSKTTTDGNTIHVATAGGLQQALANAGIEANDAIHLTLTGTLGEEDFSYLKSHLTSLNRLDLYNTDITVLPERALQGMNFETIVLPQSLKEIKNVALGFCPLLRTLEIPESVESLGRWIVEGCHYLESVTLHNGLKTLSPSTFYGCGISFIHIPATVKEIPEWCFSNCKNLERIYLHDEITAIGNGAFFNCYSLESFIAPQKLRVLSPSLFYSCSSLELVILHDEITEFGQECFSWCSSLHELMVERSDESSMPWPKALQKMGEAAFYNSGLENASMFETRLTEIPNQAFELCKNLSTLSLPQQLVKIGHSAFSNTAIPGLHLPSTFTEFGNNVFFNCPNVSMIICNAPTAPAITPETFPSNFKNSCTLYCPPGSNYDSWTIYFKRTVAQ